MKEYEDYTLKLEASNLKKARELIAKHGFTKEQFCTKYKHKYSYRYCVNVLSGFYRVNEKFIEVLCLCLDENENQFNIFHIVLDKNSPSRIELTKKYPPYIVNIILRKKQCN